MSVPDLRTTIAVQHNAEFFSGLGTFWTEHFEDNDITQALAGAAQDTAVQTDIDNTLAIQVMTDRETGPLYRTLVRYRIRIRESAMRSINGPELRSYGFGGAYGGDTIPYGGMSSLWVVDVPANIAIPRCITNKVTDPEYVGLLNSGFFYSAGVLGLRDNPFNSQYFTPQEDQNGRYVDLWFYMLDVDTRAWSKQYGIALGVSGPTSSAYRALVDGLWRNRVAGPSDTAIFKVAEGCTGVPLVHSSPETVEWIGVQGQHLCVVTDQECYRFPTTHQAVVAVGDVVREGQSLTDALQLVQGSSLLSGGPDIILPAGMFDAAIGIRKPIKFPNARVAVQDGGTTLLGNRVTRFYLEGEGQDLQRYRAAAADRGLWHALDRRGKQATTVAQAADLVATVNPAVELIARHTKPHLILLVGSPSLWPAHPDLQAQLQRQLDRVTPPHARVVVQTAAFTQASSSYSSVSLQSSSSSTVGSTGSTLTSASSVSSRSNSSNSSGSTGSSLSFSSLSDASTKSTDSSSRSISSLSSLSLSSLSSRSSQSRSSQSLSTQSVSSQSTRSSQSLSSLSSLSTASTASSSSSVTPTSMSSVTQSTQSTRSLSTGSTLSNSISSLSTASTGSSASSLSSESLSTQSLVSSQSLGGLTDSSQSSATTRSLSSDSSKSSRSNSSQSRSLSTGSTMSLSTRSSQSERSQSSQTQSTASSASSRSSGSLSSLSDLTLVVLSLSSQSSNSSSSSSVNDCAHRLTTSTSAPTWAARGTYDAVSDRYIVAGYLDNLMPTSNSVQFVAYDQYTSQMTYGFFTSNPCTGVGGAFDTTLLPASGSWTGPTNYAAPTYSVPGGSRIWLVMRSGVGTSAYGTAGNYTIQFYYSAANLSASSQSTLSTNSSSSSRSGVTLGTASASSASFSSNSTKSSRSTPSSVDISSASSGSSVSPSSASSHSSDSSRSPI